MTSKRIITLAVATAVLASFPACRPHGAEDAAGPRLIREQRMLMGTTFEIQLVTDDGGWGKDAIREAFDEIARTEELLSEWRETSEISAVNQAAGREPVAIGPELFAVVIALPESLHTISGPIWRFPSLQ